MTTQAQSEVMRLKEAAEYLQVSKITLSRWVRSGQIPGIKRGHVYLFNRRVLERWVMGDVSSSLTGETQ